MKKIYLFLLIVVMSISTVAIVACDEKADKTRLDTIISQSELLVEADYTAATWEVFSEKLATAISVQSNSKASQASVDSARSELATAKNDLVTVSSVINVFQMRHHAVLALTEETVMPSNEEAVAAAIAEYNTLEQAIKTLLASDKQLLDDLAATIVTKKAQQALETIRDNFRTSHAAALALKVTTVKIENKPIVETALLAYEYLSNQVKALLTEEKSHLDALLEKIELLEEITSQGE